MKYIIILLLILLIPITTASFGITPPYTKDHPLELAPGQTHEDFFIIQNSGEETITIRPEIVQGEEIIQITDQPAEYTIPPKEKANANIKITIPENAKSGQKYRIAIKFKPEPSTNEQGLIQFTSNIGIILTVNVEGNPIQTLSFTKQVSQTKIKEEEPEKTKKSFFSSTIFLSFLTILIFAIIITIIITISISKNKKRKSIKIPKLKDLRKQYKRQTRNP